MLYLLGVENIDCDIDAKKVTVTCGDDVDEQILLDKLLKWKLIFTDMASYLIL